jgi:hypothetical protein
MAPTTSTETKKQKRIRVAGSGCPACSHRLATPVEGFAQVYRCAKCEAIFGSCYLGDSYTLVLPYMVTVEPPAERTRYYDIECLGSKGITRRHGWYDTETRRIVQVG